MLRTGLLWLSEQPRIFRFIRRNGLARRFAARFVAGETVESGVAALRDLNAAGLKGSLDLLGESVRTPSEAHAARDAYLQTLDRIAPFGADANVSVKLTQLGLDIEEGLCLDNIRAIVARAKAHGSFVRIDMEQSDYTDRTLQLFKRRLHSEFGNSVGVVLQSYLRRTEQDVDQMIALGARVRLCKGAYQEPATIAFPDKPDVDLTYVRCMERLLLKGNYPAIATHDARIIDHAKTFARDKGIQPARFEFQMLYGVRRDLQVGLRRNGYNVRVYVPFGTQWYPYLMRRLAERPANVAFLLGNVLRESLRRS
ncbi:MAG TPA: proline dehydrogenase family protein [Gemmatimonadales bacterium]|nr:proline dehydrogenase family protein [Gemmatimonadales bacterium]